MRICLINPTFADLYEVRMSACVLACVEAGRQRVRACVRDRETVCLRACVREYAWVVAPLGFFLYARFSQYMYACGIYIALLVLSRRAEQMPFRPVDPVASLRSKHHNLFGWA